MKTGQLKVKVCGMRYPGNIRAIADLHPDYLGFIFYPLSSRYVGKALTVDMQDVIPETCRKVGVFIDTPASKVISCAEDNMLDLVQLHGNETPQETETIAKARIPVIKAFGLHADFDFSILKPYASLVYAFLFDTRHAKHGGSGEKFNWKLIEKYTLNVPFFLSGGLGPDDAEDILKIKHGQLHALDINSRFEHSPGLKDPLLVAGFISKIKDPAYGVHGKQ
jgi:phosphoribosylanthranilate isomerase